MNLLIRGQRIAQKSSIIQILQEKDKNYNSNSRQRITRQGYAKEVNNHQQILPLGITQTAVHFTFLENMSKHCIDLFLSLTQLISHSAAFMSAPTFTADWDYLSYIQMKVTSLFNTPHFNISLYS